MTPEQKELIELHRQIGFLKGAIDGAIGNLKAKDPDIDWVLKCLRDAMRELEGEYRK